MGNIKKLRLLIHISFWVINISDTFFAWQLPYYKPENHWTFCAEIVVNHTASMLYFYMIYLWAVPVYLFNRKYYAYVGAMLLSIAIYVLICAYSWNSFHFIPGLFREDQEGITFACLIYAGIGTGFRLFDFWQESEYKKRELLKELKDAELLYLQSQLSPHFLFNTLNNIYGLSLKNALETSLVVRNLKDIMSYFQQFEHGCKIVLSQEIQNLNAFIALHQIRNNVKVTFDVSCDEQSMGLPLEPMLLLPSVENAFKHGDIQQPIQIQLEAVAGKLIFKINNHINLTKRKDAVGGIGIANVQRRLDLLYQGKYDLDIIDKNQIFSLQLQLNLL
jgi:two-component system, LytTR family, sensor kinase